jgi:hypothetical protein
VLEPVFRSISTDFPVSSRDTVLTSV